MRPVQSIHDGVVVVQGEVEVLEEAQHDEVRHHRQDNGAVLKPGVVALCQRHHGRFQSFQNFQEL